MYEPNIAPIPSQMWDRLVKALHVKSNGPPLHMRYTLRALQEQSLPITETTIAQLPDCPHEDITAYYQQLWAALSEDSREILHLLAACPFPWPRLGVLECCDRHGAQRAAVRHALRQVEHLLIQDEWGLRPFHSSLLVFVASLPDYADSVQHHQRRALTWLREQAPEYWRWAYTWTLEADAGNDKPLRDGPERQWTLASIALRRDQDDITAILGRSMQVALQHGQLPRTMQVALLRDYCTTVFDYHCEHMQALLYPQLFVEEDPYLRARLRAGLDDLTTRPMC